MPRLVVTGALKHRGELAVSAERGVRLSVVDRAVYAVQSEFRPGVFDFFYPLPPATVSTDNATSGQGGPQGLFGAQADHAGLEAQR